nr:MAG TPA: hypothetical protein [Caudoviricetes sp.]
MNFSILLTICRKIIKRPLQCANIEEALQGVHIAILLPPIYLV